MQMCHDPKTLKGFLQDWIKHIAADVCCFATIFNDYQKNKFKIKVYNI